MFCKTIFLGLALFAFVQIQLRWKRDEVITNKPWLVLWKGNTKTTQQTAADFTFKAFSNKYGDALVSYNELANEFQPRERTEVEMQIVATVTGPPLSFHRIVLTVNNKPIRTLDVFIPMSGEANSEMVARFAMVKSKIKVKHYFDAVWSKNGDASAEIVVSFRSGIPNLYDTPWVYKS
jgi:hypothetical protein